MFVTRHVGDTTYQDVLDLHGEPGEYFSEALYYELFSDAVEPGSAKNAPDGGEIHTFIIYSQGEYLIGVLSFKTGETRVWFCAPFWVEEEPTD